MSRQPHLPPRCPIAKTKSLDSSSWKNENFHLQHQKSVSQSFDMEEQPAWLDDLLGDWDSGFKLKSHRRAASDSGTLLDGLSELPSVNTEKDDKNAATVLEESSCIYGPNSPRSMGNVLIELPKVNVVKDDKNAATALQESACIYGPNSPRAKEKVSVQENDIVSALSEYASHGPVQYANSDVFGSAFSQLDSVKDAVGEVTIEAKPFKRHSAQRSRVRKLQYIADLERTVESFQNIVSELAVRVDSLAEQRVYLSLENKQLKQRLARLQQEKFVMERQYQFMRNEAEVLKHRLSKVNTHIRSNSTGNTEKLHVEPAWHMIDMGKLHIN
uniref:basic leucine zipper 34 n=1 Tax=Erigeron canadensis TaxID=72917 RepID=UPI001CB90CC7|nr:basic leucine zipper 34 [Erigeron canadensis]